MILKDILVYLDDGSTNETRMKSACYLAKEHQANLTGVTFSSMAPQYLRSGDEKVQKRMSEEMAQDLVNQFAEFATEKSIKNKTIIISGNADKSSEKMAQYAQNHDLLILRQPNPDKDNYSRLTEMSEEVLLKSGRPILFMPYIGTEKCPGKRVIMTWDGTASSCRAAHNAIPLLQKADEVRLLIVDNPKTRENLPDAVLQGFVQHMKNHEVQLEVRRVMQGTYDIATVILNEVAEMAADLLVMGGYGTPSLKQKIFGGVTKSILSSMIVPVLMSH